MNPTPTKTPAKAGVFVGVGGAGVLGGLASGEEFVTGKEIVKNLSKNRSR